MVISFSLLFGPVRTVAVGNARYARGATFERKVVDYLREKEYLAIRAAGSHGVTDVVAVKKGCVLLIQCKTNAALPVLEWNELVELAEFLHNDTFEVIPVLACRGDEGIEFYELLGTREPGSRNKKIEKLNL